MDRKGPPVDWSPKLIIGDVLQTEVQSTSLEMFSRLKSKAHHWRCYIDWSPKHMIGDVLQTGVQSTTQTILRRQKSKAHHWRCSVDWCPKHIIGDVQQTGVQSTSLEMFHRLKSKAPHRLNFIAPDRKSCSENIGKLLHEKYFPSNCYIFCSFSQFSICSAL